MSGPPTIGVVNRRKQGYARVRKASRCLERWGLISALGASLVGCSIIGTSKQEDLGRGIVHGTLGAQPDSEARVEIPTNAFCLIGQVTAVEGGAYVIQEAGGRGIEHRVGHDENTRIDRPAHVGDRVEALLDDKGRAVLIRNIDQENISP